MHGFRGLADFGAGVCKATFEEKTSGYNFDGDLQSTYLFKVVDLPDDGLPTRPISGSRGIVRSGTHSVLQIG